MADEPEKDGPTGPSAGLTDVKQQQLEEAVHYPGSPRRISLGNPLGLPAPLTTRQKLYILLPQMLGAAVIDGLANFGIACAMYRTADKPITIWKLDDNTVAGDCGVTVFIQGILTFLIAGSLVHVDMRLKRIDPFPYPWPEPAVGVYDPGPPEEAQTKFGRAWRRFHRTQGLGRGLHFFSGSDVNDAFNFKLPFKELARRWFWTIWKGSVLSALYWFIWWPITIAIIAPIYDNNPQTSSSWMPEITKLIFGFTLGLAMNPVVACIALGSEDAIRLHLRDGQKELVPETNGYVPPITESEQVPPQQFEGHTGQANDSTVPISPVKESKPPVSIGQPSGALRPNTIPANP